MSQPRSTAAVASATNVAPIHYVWIGSPPEKNSKHPQHDTAGPLAMASKNKTNPIHFWCLDEYVGYYEKIFNEKRVTVHAIQSELKKMANIPLSVVSAQPSLTVSDVKSSGVVPDNMSLAQAAADTLKLVEHSLQWNTISDRVNVKDLMSIFIMKCHGGYYLDTNFFPMDGVDSLMLKTYEGFKPAYVYVESWTTELFLMYSQIGGCAQVDKVFTHYCRERLSLLLRHGELSGKVKVWGGRNISEYHYWVCDALGEAIDSVQINVANRLIGKRSSTDQAVMFNEMQIKKYYYSSHYNCIMAVDNDAFSTAVKLNKLVTADQLAPLWKAVIKDDIRLLEDLIQKQKVSVNQRCILADFYGQTVLHFACIFGKVDAIKILLANGIDTTLTGYHFGHSDELPSSVTAYELAVKLGKNGIADMLKLSATATNNPLMNASAVVNRHVMWQPAPTGLAVASPAAANHAEAASSAVACSAPAFCVSL